MNGYTNEMNSEGAVFISPGASIGVLQYGKIWARIKPEDAPAYGDKLYLIISGANAGLFTKTSGADAIEVPGRFIGGKGTRRHGSRGACSTRPPVLPAPVVASLPWVT